MTLRERIAYLRLIDKVLTGARGPSIYAGVWDADDDRKLRDLKARLAALIRSEQKR